MAVAGKCAYAAGVHPNATLDNLRLDHLDVQPVIAAQIGNARGRSLTESTVKTDDGSKRALVDFRASGP